MGYVLEVYLAFMYWLVGRTLFGKDFTQQDEVPFMVKFISGFITFISLALVIGVFVITNN